MNRTGRRGRMGAIVILGVMLTSGVLATREASAEAVEFDIAAQPLAQALNRWANQAGLQIIWPAGDPRADSISPAVKGNFEPMQALHTLLDGTGLTYSVIGEGRTIAIQGQKQSLRTASRPADNAQAEGQHQTSERASSTASVTGVERGTGQNDERVLRLEQIDEILVTGTYIRGLPPDSSPLTVYDREDIETSGVSSLDQFARERMPENFASVDAGTGVGSSAGGFSQNGNNRAFGAAFNLHGLGPGATLTLVNGRRLSSAGGSGEFVDISLIPLVAVERIEVLTDGASALYGADAVAGVVNIILRDDFDGVETAVRYGEAAQGGANELSASQLLGHSWGSGSAMLVYEYGKQDELLATDRDFIPPQGGIYTVIPEQKRNSVLINARQEIGEATTLSGDAIFSERTYDLATTPLGAPFTVRAAGEARQYGAGVSLTRKIGDDWQAVLLGNYSTTEQPERDRFPSFLNATGVAVQRIDIDTERSSIELRGDGSVFQMPGGAAKLAMGASLAREKLDDRSSFVDSGVLLDSSSAALKRKIASAYAELFIPIVGAENGTSQRLEASLAGRYDHYDDFGSSTNPKIGILWSPVAGINLRGTWGKSFRPPLLPDLIDRPSYFNFDLPDASAADGVTTTLINESIGNPLLKPERSESFTAGVDWRPANVSGLEVAVTYFDVDFEERVARPPILGTIFDIHGQRDMLAPFFDFSPDPQEVAALFASGTVQDTTLRGPGSVEALFDFRPANIAAVQQTGLDFNAAYEWSTASGEFSLSLGASHLLKNEYRAIQGAPAVSLLDLIGQPVGTRLNGSVGWSQGAFQTALSVSYWGDYRDTLTTPTAKVDSWTTADLMLGYRIGESRTGSLASGFSFALSVRNLTDETPPSVTTSIGYDPFNASPIGRFISFSVIKDW